MDVFSKLEAAQLTFEDDRSPHIEGSDDDVMEDADVKSEFSPCKSDASCSPPAGCFANGGEYLCNGCHDVITDHFLLKVNGITWHETCLKCCICSVNLHREDTCYIRENRIFCLEDYLENFTSKCAKCNLEISPSDWIRKAREYLYHLDCFSCNVCGNQMNTGDIFGLNGAVIYCEDHCSKPRPEKRQKTMATTCSLEQETTMCSTDSDSSVISKENRGTKRRRSTFCEDGSKRRRTAFKQEQLELLQEEFTTNTNPSLQEYERLCRVTGLEKRVVKVWFQNARASRKRQHQF